MHPTIGYELAKAVATDLRHQAQREARARAARRARRAPARLNVEDDAQCRVPFASTCSDRTHQAPAWCGGDHDHSAAVRLQKLHQPDGAEVQRPSGRSRRAHALDPVAAQLTQSDHRRRQAGCRG